MRVECRYSLACESGLQWVRQLAIPTRNIEHRGAKPNKEFRGFFIKWHPQHLFSIVNTHANTRVQLCL
ncbi:Pre-mRNA-splicing factor cwf23 [Fusarium oxysporum f. sp. albedinis]|nr:Pre-mRNA-splicing factor cwf23 [Fusarium oxysporum f. sp. albedinis]